MGTEKMKSIKDNAKMVIEVMSTVGIGAVVSAAIVAVTPPKCKLLQKVAMLIGGSMITMVLQAHVNEFYGERIDKIIERMSGIIEQSQTEEPAKEV